MSIIEVIENISVSNIQRCYYAQLITTQNHNRLIAP